MRNKVTFGLLWKWRICIENVSGDFENGVWIARIGDDSAQAPDLVLIRVTQRLGEHKSLLLFK